MRWAEWVGDGKIHSVLRCKTDGEQAAGYTVPDVHVSLGSLQAVAGVRLGFLETPISDALFNMTRCTPGLEPSSPFYCGQSHWEFEVDQC